MSKKPKVFLFVKYVADKMELCDHHTYDPIHVWCFWCAMSFGRSKPLLPLSIPGNIHLALYPGSVPLPHRRKEAGYEASTHWLFMSTFVMYVNIVFLVHHRKCH